MITDKEPPSRKNTGNHQKVDPKLKNLRVLSTPASMKIRSRDSKVQITEEMRELIGNLSEDSGSVNSRVKSKRSQGNIK